jgi:LacI family transcriptional regulator
VLERRFVEMLGRTPADEIRRAHLDRARQLLIETDCPVAQVAELAGFGSQAYFADAFRHQFETTPLAFRRSNRLPTRTFH